MAVMEKDWLVTNTTAFGTHPKVASSFILFFNKGNVYSAIPFVVIVKSAKHTDSIV